MGEMMLDVMESEAPSTEVLSHLEGHVEHRQVMAANLARTASGTGLEETPAPEGDAQRVSDAVPEDPRSPIEGDVVDPVDADPGLLQAIGGRVRGKADVVLLPRKPLLLGAGDDLSVPDEGSG